MFDKQVSVRTSRELYKDKLYGIPKVFRTSKFLSSHYSVDRSLVGDMKISVEVYELFLFCSEVRFVWARAGGNWRGERKEDCQEERLGPTLEDSRS